jgi:hydroxymethylbilane synthase
VAIRIGTRGSKLALWQAENVRQLLEQSGVPAEILIYKTEGDEKTDVSLQSIGGKGLFTKALDDALLRQEIEIAVHSAKDIPTDFDNRIGIIAVPEREDPRDVLLAAHERADLDNLSDSLLIGTSSVRRQAFLRHYLPHIRVSVIRGNVDTRVARMQQGDYDGIMLAWAGVKRLGLEHLVVRKMNPATFTPAVGQGAIAVTALKSDDKVLSRVRPALNHLPSETALRCERAFLTRMGGGCSIPAFGLATIVGDTISLHAGIAEEDGSTIWRDQMDGPVRDAEWVGERLAEIILEKKESHTRVI